MRLRKAQGKLKIEHSIIDGVREMLERLLASNSQIRGIIPGVIRPVRDAKGKIQVRVTVPVTNGWKAIALSGGARQELFISTTMTKKELEDALDGVRAGDWFEAALSVVSGVNPSPPGTKFANIVNALIAGETMTGFKGAKVDAIPHDRVRDILKKHGR